MMEMGRQYVLGAVCLLGIGLPPAPAQNLEEKSRLLQANLKERHMLDGLYSSRHPSTGTAPIGIPRILRARRRACAPGRRRRTGTTWRPFAWPRISISSEF
ncbi:hypothetical protein SBA4_2790004 [Candidatus Sulfopaludibacter sp. SbA4]|nr:hypothetical protein SBA4_2790004 [Candidatus Sulfopaludibacter sp. SbA4]